MLLITLLLPAAAPAAFNNIGVGARPLGLGGAFVALADDSNAADYNAAGLGYMDKIHLGATHAQRFNGLITYNAVSGMMPFGRIGTIGASFGDMAESSDVYHEQTVRLSYGNAVFRQLAIGANLKLFRTAFDATNEFVVDNPYFSQTDSSAASFDLGMIAKPVESRLRILEEVVGTAVALREDEAGIVHDERVRDDQMGPAADARPVGQIIAVAL